MKKFLLSAVFLLIQNVASAADFYSVDWDNAPEFSNKADFAKYILKCESHCQEIIPVVFLGDSFMDLEEFLKIAKNTQQAKMSWLNDDDGKFVLVLYETKIYPGAKVAHAYLTGDTSILSADEMQLYDAAVHIVEKVNYNHPTDLLKELLIHDEIANRVSYVEVEFGEEISRANNALGAIIDGKAGCQGYADAFYMLGRMCGFNVGKIQGTLNNDSHVWNTIEFGGKYYGVDVTVNDDFFKAGSNNYFYFNAPLEIMQVKHKWDSAYAPALQPTIDDKYFYFAQEFWDTRGKYFGFHSNTAEDALDYIAQRAVKQGFRFSWGISPLDADCADMNFATNRLQDILTGKYNFPAHVDLAVVRRGNWLFYFADITAKH